MNKIVHVLNTIIGTVLRDVNVKSRDVKMVKFDNYNTNCNIVKIFRGN